MSIRSSCSRTMGELLLRGYAMLADTCPDCQVPLMRDPSTKACLCVNCDAQYKDGVRISPPAPNTPDASEADTTPPEAGHSQQQGSNHPVHRSRLSTGSHVEEPSSPTASAGQAADDMTQPPARQSSDDVAEEISQKLLAGWALLDAHCPRCSTPLVRQKATRRMFCCGCDMWVLTEQQAAAATASRSAGVGTSNAVATLPPAASPTAARAAATSEPVTAASNGALPALTPAAAALDHDTLACETAVTPSAQPVVGGGAANLVKQEPEELRIQNPVTGSHRAGVLSRPQLNEARQAALADVEGVVVQRLREITQVLMGSGCAVAGAGADPGACERLDKMLKLAGSCVSVLDLLSKAQAHA